MALATNSTPGEIVLNGDLHGSGNALQPELTPTGVIAGTYNAPNLVVDTKGRILSIEEPSSDNVPCATVSSCGIVQVGGNLEVTDAIISIPDGTASSRGKLQAGEGLAVDGNGLVTIDFSPATETVIGTVIVPTSGNLDVDILGNVSVPLTTAGVKGVAQPGAGLSVDGAGELTFDAIPDATTSVKGLVTVGDNIDVFTGQISIPIATASTVGVLSVDDSGDLDIDGAGELTYSGTLSTPPTATTTAQGFVIVPTAGHVDVDGSGNISLPLATTPSAGSPSVSTTGVVSVGTGFTATNGIVNADVASISNVGIVSIGNDISVDGSGVISISDVIATPTILGEIIIPTSGNIDVDGTGNISIPNGSITEYGVIRADNSNISIVSGDLDVGTTVGQLDSVLNWLNLQANTIVTPSLPAGVTLDLSLGSIFDLEVDQFINITTILNDIDSSQITLIIRQDIVGGWGVSFVSTIFKFDSVGSNLTTEANSISIVTCNVDPNGIAYCSLLNDFK